MMISGMETCSVLGIDCFAGELGEAADAVVDRAESGHGGYACFGNAHVLATAQRDPQLATALRGAWTVFPDGFPVAWAQRRSGRRGAARVGGPDLMPLVVDRGRSGGLRHFMFGSSEGVVDGLIASLETSFPGVEIAGRLSPPIGEFDDAEAIRTIRAARPDVVWVAFGAPRQELLSARFADELTPAVLLTVGAAFDFLSGTKPRAPEWMQTAGLEWLHRLASEPRRLTWRYLSTNSRFAYALLRDRIAS